MKNYINLVDDTANTFNIRHIYRTNQTLTRTSLLKVTMIACAAFMVLLCCNACREVPFRVPHHPEDPAVPPYQTSNHPGVRDSGSQYSHNNHGAPCLYGKVEIVSAGADYKVEVVNIGADLQVKKVDFTPSSCGEWQIVDIGADFKVEIVDIGADFKIEFVN